MKVASPSIRDLVWSPQRTIHLAVNAAVWAAGLISACTVSADEYLNAIRTGNLDRVKMYVKEQPELVNRDADGEPPLYWAVVDHRVDVARFLLENGANVNQPGGQYRYTPIFEAQTAEMAKLLMKHGAKLNVKTQRSVTSLQMAVRGNHVGVVRVLVDAGEKLDFDSAVQLGETKLVAEMLAEKPWLAKPPRKPLYYAAQDGNLELVKLLLEHGADPDLDFGFSNISGPFTPVSNAVTGGHYEIAELLLQHGANSNASGGRNHDNLFLFAIAYLDAKFTKLMLDHGADLVIGDSWGHAVTPLHVAAALGGAAEVGRVGRVGQPDSLASDKLQVLEKVRYLLEAGADVNAQASDGSTPLLSAAIAGHPEVCDLLLKHGAKMDVGSACLLGRREIVEQLIRETPELLNKKDLPLRLPALHCAARAGDVALVEFLLSHGAQVNAWAPELEYQDAGGFASSSFADPPGPTALHIAAEMGHEQMVSVLLDHGADINSKVGDREHARSAIAMACGAGHQGTARLLLDRGAKVDLNADSAYLLSDITDPDLLARLLDATEIDFQGQEGTSFLAEVVAPKNPVAVDLLLARGVQFDIFSACTLGRIDDVRRLIEATPALVNGVQTEYPRETPLSLAVQNGHVDIVRLLITKGAKLSSPDDNHESLVHQAAKHGHLDVLQLLLSRGFSLDAKDDAGSTLLHAAASGGQPDIARYLISQGAGVNVRNFDRETVLHMLGQWGWVYGDENVDEEVQRTLETAKVLLEAGAEVDVTDRYDRTPLHQAASKGLEGVAELLLARGADVNARDFRNETPLGEVEGSVWLQISDRKLEPVTELLHKHGGVK